MPGMRIRKDDSVLVTSGKDKGKTGRVIRTEPARRRVFVEGLNMVKRHTRPRSVKDTQKAQSSGIIEKEGPIDVSNVMLLDPTDNQPTRVGVLVTDGGVQLPSVPFRGRHLAQQLGMVGRARECRRKDRLRLAVIADDRPVVLRLRDDSLGLTGYQRLHPLDSAPRERRVAAEVGR